MPASSIVMAGVGEASAIVSLIGTAATLSKAVVDIASKYKNARNQIESFGREVGILGNVLNQLQRLQEKDYMEADDGIRSVTMTILGQCAELFSELETYRDALYSRPGSVRSLTFRGKTKWVFTAVELDYIRTRLESVKTNMLLMMTMQCLHNSDRSRNDRTIQELSIQSDGWVKRLETLEKEMMIPMDSSNDAAVNRMSIRVADTADLARSTRDSILSLYGHSSYYQETLDPHEGSFATAIELQADYSQVSRIIDEHLDDDLLPGKAAPNAVNKRWAVLANASTKPSDNPEQLQFFFEASEYPCRAIAIQPYKAPSFSPFYLSFEKNEVLQVRRFIGPSLSARKNTGEKGQVLFFNLKAYYPHSARARFDLRNRTIFASKDEILGVSDKVEFESPTGGRHVWRPWRKMTGEAGISPDHFFHCFQLNNPVLLPPPESSLDWI